MSFSYPDTLNKDETKCFTNQFDSRNFVVYSNDDFFEKDLFNEAVYDKDEHSHSIPQSKSTTCPIDGVICNSSIKTVNTQSEKNEKSGKYNSAIDGYVISIDNIFDMNEEELFKFTHSKEKNDINCISPLIVSKKDLENVNKDAPKATKVEKPKLILSIEAKDSNRKSKIEELLSSNNAIMKDTVDAPKITDSSRKESYFYSNSDITDMAFTGTDFRFTATKDKIRTSSNLSYFAANTNNFNTHSLNDKQKKLSVKYNDFYEFPSVGVGIILIHKEKVLLGRRIDSGMYGLPGGWLEFGESWAECAARELQEETGLSMLSNDFKHIFTLNSINKEKNYHSVSCVMMAFAEDKEVSNLVNKEPNKCYGWFWISLQELRSMYSLLFYPLREFLIKHSKIKKASEFKNLQKEKLDIDSLFSNEEFML